MYYIDTTYIPRIFDKKGKAELIISNKAQFPITRLNGVLLGFGLTLLMQGAV